MFLKSRVHRHIEDVEPCVSGPRLQEPRMAAHLLTVAAA